MKQLGLLAGIFLLAHVPGAFAQAVLGGTSAGSATYRCVDSAGRSTYTNVQEEMGGKKCTLVSREISVVPAPPLAKPVPPPAPAARTAAPGTPANRIDPQVQRSRDNDRRRILQDELQSAEKTLADARQRLSAQEAIRNGDEKNYQRVLDRLKPFQDEVRRAEDNVAALKRELSNLR